MTTQNTKNPTSPQIAPGTQPAAPKENILSKIGGGLSWWIGSLTGKPQAKKPVVSQPQPQQAPPPASAAATPQPVQQPSAPAVEDSVTADIEKFRKLVGKFSSGVSKSVGPAVSKGYVASSKKALAIGQSNQKFIRLVLKVFFIIVFLMIIGFIAMRLFQKGPGGNGEKPTPSPEEGGPTSTPTPIVFNPTKPSVYAEDEVILKIEEDINVLVREISGTNIKETQLNPPVLDFAISF